MPAQADTQTFWTRWIPALSFIQLSLMLRRLCSHREAILNTFLINGIQRLRNPNTRFYQESYS
jgi:hypothetical protein